MARAMMVFAAIILAAAASVLPARALSCPPFLYSDAYIDLMPIIFGGTVMKIERTEDGQFDVVTFRIDVPVKATDGSTMRVAVPASDAFGRYPFAVGQSQTVFVYPNTRRTLPPISVAEGRTDICAMTNAEKVRLDPATRGGSPTDLERAVDAIKMR